jgi:hypothetical protein
MSEKEGIGQAKATSLNISKAGRFSIGGTKVTTTAAELNMLAGSSNGFSTFPKLVKQSLNAIDTAAGVFSWLNPEPNPVIVIRLVLDLTFVATGACTLDIGGAATSVLADNLIDGIDVHTATLTADNLLTPGANGKAVVRVPVGGFVTGSTASGASAGMQGNAYIEYVYT